MFPAADVLHIRGFSVNGLLGASRITLAREAIALWAWRRNSRPRAGWAMPPNRAACSRPSRNSGRIRQIGSRPTSNRPTWPAELRQDHHRRAGAEVREIRDDGGISNSSPRANSSLKRSRASSAFPMHMIGELAADRPTITSPSRRRNISTTRSRATRAAGKTSCRSASACGEKDSRSNSISAR
jgi:hypothetical protein